MKTTRFAAKSTWRVSARRAITGIVLAGAVILAPAFAILANAADTTVSAQAATGAHHGGPDYRSITGARVGAPSEQDVTVYGGSHKHLWVEQQLYGPGVVDVPRVDTTVQQSR
jgi:hypothetical protein